MPTFNVIHQPDGTVEQIDLSGITFDLGVSIAAYGNHDLPLFQLFKDDGQTYNFSVNYPATEYGMDINFSDVSVPLRVDGSGFSDRLEGGSGDDYFRGAGGGDTLIGNDGMDTVDYSYVRTGIKLQFDDAGNGIGARGAAGDRLSSIEKIVGSRYDDSVTDSAGSWSGRLSTVSLGGGDDKFVAYGMTVYDGGTGTDTLVVGAGTSYIAQEDSLKSVEKFYVGSGGELDLSGADLSLLTDGSGVSIVSQSNDNGDDYTTIMGSTGDDRITDAGIYDKLSGGAGNDVITVQHNAGGIDGGDGYDTLVLDYGSGTFFGLDHDVIQNIEMIRVSNGVDMFYNNLDQGLRIVVSAGTDHTNIFGTNFNDRISLAGGYDDCSAGDGNDWVRGGDGNDVVYGDDGRDRLFGQAGNDILNGGDRNDFLQGGDGDDTLIGGRGVDLLAGGTGADTFVYSSVREMGNASSGRMDSIVDFDGGSGDRIDVTSVIGPDPRSEEPDDQQFTFIGANAFSADGTAEIRYADNHDGRLIVQFDVDGNGTVDGSIAVTTAVPLTANDFLL